MSTADEPLGPPLPPPVARPAAASRAPRADPGTAAAARPPAAAEPDSETAAAQTPRSARADLFRQLAAWPVATAGAALIAWSYSIAATSAAANQRQFAVFWVGMLLVTVPTFVVAVAPRTPARTRLIWITAYALFTFVPKLLRNPSVPLYYDEVAHWRQTTGLAASGTLFQPNALINIIADFPGMHILTAAISDATGLSVWRSAEIVLLLAHVAALLGAVALGEAVFGSLRAGIVTGLIYSLNSSYLYFDTEFGYESLGIVYFIWCLACVAWMYRARTARRRAAWCATAAILACAAVPIHHLSSLFLLAALVFVTVAALLTRRGGNGGAERGVLWAKLGVAGLLAVVTGAWFTLAAPHTYAYLSPYFGGGLNQLSSLWSGNRSGGRSLYSASTVPRYEQVAAYAAPVIAGLFALAGVLAFLRRDRKPDPRPEFARWLPMRTGLSAFGLLYFVALPFILTSSGAEGARRSWGFTYLGLAVLITPVALRVLDSPRWRTEPRRRAVGAVAVCAGCVVLVGNVSAGLDEDYRFPGPYVYGSDTRAVTPELVAAADWLARNVPGQQLIVTDRYTGLVFVRQADSLTATPSAGFPAYNLFFYDTPPSANLVAELATSHYAYMIVDSRMAQNLPAQGEYFGPGEPARRVPASALDQYGRLPWTTRIYQSDHYSIYRFDFSAVGAQVTGGTP